jgi:hypothetical protein
MKKSEVPNEYCATCDAFREGTLEYVTQTKRWFHYRFLCSWCLHLSEIVSYKKTKK